MNFDLIQKLSLQEPKTLLQRMVKLQEEVGELAQEVLIRQNASGTQHKAEGPDGILGECVDVILVAASIFALEGGTQDDFETRVNLKCAKWERHQLKQGSI